MAIPVLGRFDEPTSIRQLTRGRGWNSELVGFLLPFARQDYIYKEYDFCETAITDDPNTDWSTDDGGATSSAVFATDANAENGTITADTGTDGDKGIALIHDSINLNANKNPGIHVVMQLDVVTELACEIGMCDALTDESLVACTDYGAADYTIGNGLAAGVFVGCDTDTQATANAQNTFTLVTEGATGGAEGVILDGVTTTAVWPALAATDFDVVVQAFEDGGYAVWDHNQVYAKGLSTGPDADQLMRYRIFTGTRDGTAVFPTIDLIRIWQNRV